ncbi:MAG TPA: extracellular solute-binding protein [Feifaniaceae bacterium]|nr:extracellular solute-binding protein [Feifaniaceae bacterium]
MKSTWKKLLALACVICLLMAQFAACSPTTEPTEETTQATTEPAAEATAAEPAATEDVYAISGTVSIAYPEGEVAEIQPVLEAFRAQYPNVTVEEVPFAGSTGGAFNEFLTQRAAANDMPDMMWLDWNDFAPEVASGFVMPLNDLIAGDPDAEYVPAGMTDPYTYNGKLYALPCQMNAMGITINLDMLDALNIERPSYDWTFAEFEELLKKAISADTVGAATLEDLDQVYSAQAAGFMYPAYDAVNQTFDFTNKWVPAMNKLAELRAIPGLEAWSMRFPKNEDGTTSLDSDYVAKFGEAGKDDNHYTFKNGMALLCTNATWNDNWMRSECTVNWDYWPYPRLDENTPVYTPIHVDCAYLTSTCAEPEVAFQLLKWLTYGVEGNLQRLDIFAARGDAQAAEGDTKLLKTWFIPCTQNPDVLAKFEQNTHLTEGFKALYRSTENSIRGDLNKILPGYSAIFTDEVNALINSVRNGEASAADVGPQIDALVNPALAEQLAAFNEKVQ